MDLATATEAVDFGEAKKHLPIAWLLEQHGFNLQVVGPRLKCLCPFHEELDPSFNVFASTGGTDLDRYHCWSCQAKGDAIELLKHFEPELVGANGKATAAFFSRIRELIVEVADSGWAGPSGVVPQKPFDAAQAEEIVVASQNDPSYKRIEEFLSFKKEQRGEHAWPYPPSYLMDTWRVGTYGSWWIIPYYDSEQQLIAYKRWTAPEKPRMAVTGSSWSGHLYGDWFPDDDDRPILLCEGESDTWYAHFYVGEVYRVLGLPTGTNSSTAPAERMAGRTVFIAFDGDQPGRSASQKWAEELERHGANVRIVPVPEGKDLSTAGEIEILIRQARPLVKAPPGITETPGGYVHIARTGIETAISNWVFRPERELHGDGTYAYEGKLLPGGNSAVIRAADLESDAKIKKWCNRNGRSWFGSSRDAALLLGKLQASGVFLPAGRLVTVAGLHGDTFVWPGGKIGPEPLTYVPPAADANLEKHIKVRPGPWDTSLIHTMREVQRREVTDPILAWLAVAPLRDLAERFPFVAVSGAHGSGKTETTQTLIHAFAGSYIEATFKSSAHAMSTAVASTNADVVNLEEYRPGGNDKARAAGEQLLREAYTKQSSSKGGAGDNWAALTESIPSAPIIVTGEDMMVEGSHVERMVPIKMDEAYQNPKVFEYLREIGTNGFPYAYRAWLQTKIAQGLISFPLQITPGGPTDLPSRQRYNIGILHFGWSLLQEFMSDNNDRLDDAHFSFVIRDLGDSNKHTPIEEAINWCLGEVDARGFCYPSSDGTEVWVQPESFYVFLSDSRRSQLFTLPGRVPAIKQYMLTRLGGETQHKNGREFIVMKLERLVQ